MKKFFVLFCATLGFYAFHAQAEAMNNNASTENQVATVTIGEALTMPDDTSVIIVGTLTENLGDEKYKLKDNSGEVIIEIDNDEWVGVAAVPGNMVQIQGEIDRDGNESVEIDVESAKVQQ